MTYSLKLAELPSPDGSTTIAKPPAIPPPDPGTPNPIQLDDAGQAECFRVSAMRSSFVVDL